MDIHRNQIFMVNANIHSHDTRSAKLIRKSSYILHKSDKNTLNESLFNILPDKIKHLCKNKFNKVLTLFELELSITVRIMHNSGIFKVTMKFLQ